MAVARVPRDVTEVEQRVERAAERLAADVELALQLDEPRAFPVGEQRERRRGPAVVEERDELTWLTLNTT